jgi:tRNA-splicing ligase RtcB
MQLFNMSKPIRIFGKEEIDTETLEQMDTAMKLPITIQGALMPDAHVGYGLPIGGVLATDNAVIPYGVGMDIACRMCLSIYALPVDDIYEKKDFFKKMLNQHTRFGKRAVNKINDHPFLSKKEFDEISFLKELKSKILEQLGTSGGGNHFVEFGVLAMNQPIVSINLRAGKYMALLSHSGSRNFGASVARYYTDIAKQKCSLPKGVKNLAWLTLDSEEGIEYWKAMNLAGEYAAANHEIIHDTISKALGTKPSCKIENHHNFAWKEQLTNGQDAIVHRKGATPASKGAIGVIPGSMVHPAYVVIGKGSSEAINSASHGAGRLFSREQAKKTFSAKDLHKVLIKHNVDLIGGGIDEVPMAYKNIHKVMNCQSELVEKAGLFYPKIVKME